MDSHRGYIPFVNGWYTGSGSTAVIIGPSSLRHKCHRRTPRQVSSWGSSIYNVSIAVDASEFQLDSLNTILYPGSSMTPWILHWLYRWVAIEVLCNAATPLPLQAPHPRLHQYSPRLHHFNSRPYTMLGVYDNQPWTPLQHRSRYKPPWRFWQSNPVTIILPSM